MRVVDLLNALQRFPGKASVSGSGSLDVEGVAVVDSGKPAFVPVKGTKGPASAARKAVAPRARGRSDDE